MPPETKAKLLYGDEVARFIKQRHYGQVRGLPTPPRLAIVHASSDPATDRYIRAKQRYARDIGAVVEVHAASGEKRELIGLIHRLNDDPAVSGIILQLPLPDRRIEGEVVEAIAFGKDVDGLGTEAKFDHATALGIQWLLAANGVELRDRPVAVVGQGIVGRSVAKLLAASGARVAVADESTADLAQVVGGADIIISATGRPGLIGGRMVRPGAVVVDAGIALVDGRIAGDAAPELFGRSDVAITPNPGGVGPMTVAALFDNLLRAAAGD